MSKIGELPPEPLAVVLTAKMIEAAAAAVQEIAVNRKIFSSTSLAELEARRARLTELADGLAAQLDRRPSPDLYRRRDQVARAIDALDVIITAKRASSEPVRDAGGRQVTARSPETMSLADVQAELRAISGTPYRSDEDRFRRQALWRRIDVLTAKSFEAAPAGLPCVRIEHYCAICGKRAAFGRGVSLRNGRAGTWYCAEHRYFEADAAE